MQTFISSLCVDFPRTANQNSEAGQTHRIVEGAKNTKHIYMIHDTMKMAHFCLLDQFSESAEGLSVVPNW